LVVLVGRDLNRLASLKVRSRVTHRCPRRDCMGTAGQTDTTVGLSLLVAVRCPIVRKSSSSEQTRDKVRRRFTLLVTARVGGMTGQAPMLLVVLTAVVVRDSLK